MLFYQKETGCSLKVTMDIIGLSFLQGACEDRYCSRVYMYN